MLLAVWILEKPLRLNSIEKVSIIYTNAGYLVIPLVSAVLGEEWVFYTTAFLLVQNLLTWTHGVSVLKGESERNYRQDPARTPKSLLRWQREFCLFAAQIRLPAVLASCVESMSGW